MLDPGIFAAFFGEQRDELMTTEQGTSRAALQIRRDSEVTLGQRFAALDHGLAPSTPSVFGGGLPITVVPDRDDPLEQLWHLPSRQGPKIGSEPYDDPTQGRKLGSDPYDDPTRAR
jgi:hypothetical protein